MDLVTKIIEHDEDVLRIRGVDVIHISRIQRLFRGIPREPYQVIYHVSSLGKHFVEKYEDQKAAIRGTYICFLPHTWIGQRVNRYVVPLSAAKRRP